MCKHEQFTARVEVSRLEDIGRFMAAVTVRCAQCNAPFKFLGLEPGIDLGGARVSIDGLEANIAIAPKGSVPSPLQRMAFGINKFES